MDMHTKYEGCTLNTLKNYCIHIDKLSSQFQLKVQMSWSKVKKSYINGKALLQGSPMDVKYENNAGSNSETIYKTFESFPKLSKK